MMLKRAFDLISALVGLVLLSPLLVFISVCIRVDSPGPVLYRQERVGRFGVPFRIHKFRTMCERADAEGRLTIGRDRRITRIGSFLRKYKLDELPQLIDVLVGNMSMVGPRPEVQEFIDYYAANVRTKVLSVRPGITDYAAIEMVDENEILSGYENPRQAYIDVILPSKQKYYVDYVDTSSFKTDVIIILLTLKKIVIR